MAFDREADRNPVLSIQAQKLYSELDIENPSNFVACRCWVHHFQCPHEITQVKVNGEAWSADTNAAHDFVPIFKESYLIMYFNQE